ncbi:MAG: tol-pal system YbgF family protein [Acidobacteriota bacterium]
MSGSRRGRLLAAAVALVTSFVMAACAATLGTTPRLQRDVDDLRVTVDRLRQEQTETRATVGRLSAPDAPQDLSAQILSLTDRLDALEAQMQALAVSLQGNDERLAGLGYDVARLRRLQESLSHQIPAPGSAATRMEDPNGPVAGDLSLGATPVEAPSRGAPVATGPLDQDPAGVFQKAYADYSRGDYDIAALGFSSVRELRPGGSLADDALYYLAEIARAQDRNQEAVKRYGQVIAEYPDGDKVPAAILKKGLLLIDMNHIGEGVVQLDHLVRTYPETDEARLARNKLRSLGVDP